MRVCYCPWPEVDCWVAVAINSTVVHGEVFSSSPENRSQSKIRRVSSSTLQIDCTRGISGSLRPCSPNPILQFHPEPPRHQFPLSLSPANPKLCAPWPARSGKSLFNPCVVFVPLRACEAHGGVRLLSSAMVVWERELDAPVSALSVGRTLSWSAIRN
jgi:hypothetical protein